MVAAAVVGERRVDLPTEREEMLSFAEERGCGMDSYSMKREEIQRSILNC